MSYWMEFDDEQLVDQIINLQVARTAIESMPVQAFWPRLGGWWKKGKTKECGAVGCFGGWVAAMPYFRRKGVRRDTDDGAPVMRTPYGALMLASEVSNELFGDPNMFFAMHESSKYGDEGDSPKKAILRRIDIRLAEIREELGER